MEFCHDEASFAVVEFNMLLFNGLYIYCPEKSSCRKDFRRRARVLARLGKRCRAVPEFWDASESLSDSPRNSGASPKAFPRPARTLAPLGKAYRDVPELWNVPESLAGPPQNSGTCRKGFQGRVLALLPRKRRIHPLKLCNYLFSSFLGLFR